MLVNQTSHLLRRHGPRLVDSSPVARVASFFQKSEFSSTTMTARSKETLSKKEIAAEIAESHDLTLAESKRILNTVLDTIVDAVGDDRHVQLSKFGSFSRFDSKARMGRNPYNGQEIHIPAKKRIRFKPYKDFKSSANGAA